MKIYWADREGNPAPAGALFHLYPFSSKRTRITTQNQVRELPPPIRLQIVRQSFLPNKEEWMKKVEQALHLIDQNRLQKVVLARTCTLELNSSPDPFAIAASLRKKAKNAHLFCFQSENGAFLGASPERLFKREGTQIFSEAIAGTRRRGRDPKEDEELKNELLASPKDLREFLFVKEYIQATLAPYASNLQFTPPSICQTQNVQHLYTQCSAHLSDPSFENRIIPLLYPTPALCGTPKKEAFEAIAALEPFDRGFYGGAIGWTTPDASDWIVPIRSCKIEKMRVTLYSGVGIVAGSDPETEWDELNQKINLFMELS